MTRQLRRMARYGILGRYLPAFGRIVGQMQHDLFHSYTVDAHTLQVIENMRRFLRPENEERFPVTSRVARVCRRSSCSTSPACSTTSARGAAATTRSSVPSTPWEFCEQHGLSRRDTNLVEWLVRNHLLMSAVSQRKDISDPDVVSSSPSMSAIRTVSTTCSR
jgi:[protein-PII] uridylyltransferase